MIKIKLRKIELDDANFLLKNLKDKSLLRGKGSPLDVSCLTIDKEKSWIKKELESYKKEKFPLIKCIIEVNNLPVGLIGIMLNDEDNMNCEVYYWIAKESRGNNIGSLALKKFLKKIKSIGYKRVEARVLKYNLASQRVLEKCGFRREGEKIKSTIYNGKRYNDFIYGIVFR